MYIILVRILVGNQPPGRPKTRWRTKIKMPLKETGHEMYIM
jgi:hypothetical protein